MTDQLVSIQIVEAVAETAGVDPLELPPLYETIDPEAIDALIADLEAGQSTSADIIKFAYADHMVTVHSDQTVEVTDTVTRNAESTQPGVGAGD